MKSLCIAPCGSKKIWSKNLKAGPAKARDVYIGPFAKKCREYAEKFYPSSWYILSAKYGFLLPDDVIPGPYNVSFNDKKTNPISLKDLARQAEQKKINKYKSVVVLGGGIGYMMGKLNDAIVSGRRL